MQTYIRHGLGFSASLLTDTEFATILATGTRKENGVPQLTVQDFSEVPMASKDWATVVLADFGELGQEGKLVTLQEVTQALTPISNNTELLKQVRQKLVDSGLEHLASAVRPIIFCSDY